jgi:phage shock protein PspC (stress-responsive transcriptional regulator)
MPARPDADRLDAMTTMTEPTGPTAPVPPPPPPVAPRRLRRSNDDRLAAGVAGGLGEYFGLDPVLFRVLFAVTSFFGGAGVIAYLLAWVLIPDHTTPQAPMDRIANWMRRHKIPFWLAAAVVLIVAWATFFSWWAPPGPSFVVVVAIVVLAIALSRRTDPKNATPSAAATQPPATSAPDPAAFTAPAFTPPAYTAPLTAPAADAPYLSETRAWIQESRERRRRSAPVRWATLGALVAAIGGLAIADAIGGIVIPVYFWVGGAIVLLGLGVGLATRRTPWGLTVLLVPAVLGLIAFGNSPASFHDGSGRTDWAPASASQLDDQYRLAFGQLTLDLRSINSIDSPRTINITQAAGQVHLLLPKTLNASVHADVHLGDVRVDDNRNDSGPNDAGGISYNKVVPAPATATGAALTINVHLAAGDVKIDHS